MRSSKGSTLIEVLVSLVIFSIGALGLSNFQSFILQSTSLAKQRTEALLEANNMIESLKVNQVEDIKSQGKHLTQGSNTLFTTRWEKSAQENWGTMLETTISWPDRNNIDKNIKPLASQQTTLSFKSIIPAQPYSDDSLKFKIANTNYISLTQTTPNKLDTKNLTKNIYNKN